MKCDVNVESNMLVCTGTHDNETLDGWYKLHPLENQKRIFRDLTQLEMVDDHIIDQIKQYTLSLNANGAKLRLQDILRFGVDSRINRSQTIGSLN